MARNPEWFERLDAITETLRSAEVPWLGRKEMQSAFGCSERDSVRLLHKFGAKERHNALQLPRAELLTQLEAIRGGSTYAAFLQQRGDVAKHLREARAEASARQFRARSVLPDEPRKSLNNLPGTITWRRAEPAGSARFEIVYDDGADLMWQLAEFLSAAGADRDEFFEGTEPRDGSPG